MTDDGRAVPSALATVPHPLRLTSAADEAAVDATHDLVARLWAGHDASVPARTRQQFETAVIEVLTNVVSHAFSGPGQAEAPEVDITMGVDAHHVVCVISDNAGPSRVDLDHVTLPELDAESGRGLAMALAATSELTLARVDGRNVWTLRCDLA